MTVSIKSDALTVSSLSADVSATSSNAVTLVNYAANYESFYNSDYVVFCCNSSEYYIAWGKDFYVDGNVIKSDNPVDVCLYYRNSNYSGYTYVHTTSSNLSVTCDRVVTSNMSLGQRSAAADTFNQNYNEMYMYVLIGAFVIFGTFIKMRRGYTL